ncbi:MAG: hypothetical protein KF819_07295, partial [Labilithrix sp.]|nr:hypothetical protein [Labilithrix sp.]
MHTLARRLGFVTLTAVLGVGCGSSRLPGRAERAATVTSSWTSDPVDGPFCNTGADGTAVTPRWLSSLVGTYSRTKDLEASITNRLSVSAYVQVELRA